MANSWAENPQSHNAPVSGCDSVNSGEVVLVDEQDNPIGTAEKLAAHQNGGRLHRAFSVFLFDRRGRMLLQQRAAGKYHFAGLWTNTCCSHPGPGEPVVSAARRRLFEEFGIDVPLTAAFNFIYRASDPASGLTEQELDHVLTGLFDSTPNPNPAEIQAWRWVGPAALRDDVQTKPHLYTPWFRIVLDRVLKEAASDKTT